MEFSLLGRFVTGGFAVLTLTLLASASNAQNLVVNSGFETGDLSGWSVLPAGGGSLFGVTGNPNSGNFSVSFGAVGGQDDVIEQTFATSPGGAYTFSFYLANSGGGGDHFAASWNGNPLLDISPSASDFAYTLFSFDVTASGPTSTVTFASYDGPSYFYLDDVQVATRFNAGSATAPEPMSLAFCLLPIAGTIVARRRIAR